MVNIEPRKSRRMKHNFYTIVEVRDEMKRYCRNLNNAYWNETEKMAEETRCLAFVETYGKPPLDWWQIISRRDRYRLRVTH